MLKKWKQYLNTDFTDDDQVTMLIIALILLFLGAVALIGWGWACLSAGIFIIACLLHFRREIEIEASGKREKEKGIKPEKDSPKPVRTDNKKQPTIDI